MGDLIYRQDAVNAIKSMMTNFKYGKSEREALDDAQSLMCHIPSAVQCKKCKWHGYLTCSNPVGVKGWVTDTDFCSFGEEREEINDGMIREEAESLLNEYLDKYETMTDYIRREDYIVWTQVAEDKAVLEYRQLKDKLIELICGQV